MTNRNQGIAWGWVAALATGVLVAAPATAGEGGLILMPDFERTLPLLLLAFVLLIYPVNALIFRPIFKVLEERDHSIAGNRESARRLNGEADETLERYERSVRDAREEAEANRKSALEITRREFAEQTQDVRSQAEQEVGRAREEIERLLTETRGELRVQANQLASEAASRILGRPLS